MHHRQNAQGKSPRQAASGKRRQRAGELASKGTEKKGAQWEKSVTDRALGVGKRSQCKKGKGHTRGQTTRQEPWPQSGQEPTKGPVRASFQPHSNPRRVDTISTTTIISILQTSKNKAPRSQGTCPGYQGQQGLSPSLRDTAALSPACSLRVFGPALGLPAVAGPFAFWDPRRRSLIRGPAGLCREQLLRKVRATLGSSYGPTRRAVPAGKTGAPADLRVDLGSLCRRAGTSERRLPRDEDAHLIWLAWGSILSALKLAGGKGHSQARTRGNCEAPARGPHHPTGLSGRLAAWP